MPQFTEAKLQNVTAQSVSNLLAALKSGGDFKGSKGSLFEALLSEIKPKAPQKPQTDSNAAATGANDSRADQSSQPATSRESGADLNDDQTKQAQAADKAERHADAAAARHAQAKDARAADPKAPAQAQAHENVPAQSQAAAAQTKKTETDEEQVTASEDEDQALDEETLQEILAALVPLEEKMKTMAEDAEKTQKTGDEAQATDLAGMIEAEIAALMAMRQAGMQMKTKKKGEGDVEIVAEKSKVKVGTAQETLTGALAQNDNAKDALSQDDLLAQADAAQELFGKAQDAQAGAGKGADLMPWQEAKAAAQSQGGETKTSGYDYEKLFGPRESTAQMQQAAASATAPTLASTTAAAISLEGLEGGDGAASIGAAKAGPATMPTVPSEGVRTAGSYDFASQLSSLRATKGGAQGLPHAVEQVSVQLHKAVKDGQTEMTILLKPAELGKIEIKLEMTTDNKVQGTVVADSQATLNMLLKDQGGLQRALQDAGLQADSGCLQFSLRDGGQNGQGGSHQPGKHNASTQFGAFDQADEWDGLSAASTETYYIAPGRVNLRV